MGTVCCQRGPRGVRGAQGAQGGSGGGSGSQGAQGAQGAQGCGCPSESDICDGCFEGSADHSFQSDFDGAIAGSCSLGTGGTTVDGGKWAVNAAYDCATIQHDTVTTTQLLTQAPADTLGANGLIMLQQNPVPTDQLTPSQAQGNDQDFALCVRFSMRGDFTSLSVGTPSAQVGLAAAGANPLDDVFFGIAVYATSPSYVLMSRYISGVSPIVATIPLPVLDDGLFHTIKVSRLAGDPLTSNGDGTATVQYSVQIDGGPVFTYTIIVQEDVCMIPTIVADASLAAGGTELSLVDLRMDAYCLQFNDTCGIG